LSIFLFGEKRMIGLGCTGARRSAFFSLTDYTDNTDLIIE